MSKMLLCIACLLTMVQSIQCQSYFNSYDGAKIAYSDEGKGSPVLLLHGFLGTRKNWDNTALKQELLHQGFRVIVPDLRGNGDSDKPQNDAAYANDAEIRDLILLMDHLKLKKYKAVGYSRGSIVLAKLLTVDKRIKKAVLGGMGIDFTNPDWNRKLMFSAAFAGEVNETTEGAVAYAKSIDADFRSLHLQQKHQPVTTLAQLAALKTNVLVIAGNRDRDNGNPSLLQKAIPKSRLVLVEGDHNGTYKTKAFSSSIMRFLK